MQAFALMVRVIRTRVLLHAHLIVVAHFVGMALVMLMRSHIVQLIATQMDIAAMELAITTSGMIHFILIVITHYVAMEFVMILRMRLFVEAIAMEFVVTVPVIQLKILVYVRMIAAPAVMATA